MQATSLLLCLLAVVVALVIPSGNAKTLGTPEQVHLSLTGDPSQMVVQWITWQATSTPVVRYGAPSKTEIIAAGKTTTYDESGWGGFIHTVLLTDLKPDTVYSYVCGSEGFWSDRFFFHTEPTEDKAINVAVLGDMGLDDESDNTVASLANAARNGAYNFVLHAGDIAYTYDDDTGTNQTRFDAYMMKIQPIVAYSPYMVAAGNQEFPYLFSEYRNRFRMPFAESGSDSNLWYSYNVGRMHYVAISTEHHLNPGSPQYQWLEADLQKANANRQKQPWVVVYGHRPLYCSNAIDDASWFKDCYIVAPGIRSFIEPLFRKYSVDIYFSGHMHDAEFTYPLYQSQITSKDFTNPPSTVHIISGYAGCREGFNGFSNDTQFPWTVWRQAEHYGYGHMTYNSTHVHFQYLYADDDKVHKDVWIVKDKHAVRPNVVPEDKAPARGTPSQKVQHELDVLNVHLSKTKYNSAGADIKNFLIGFGIGLGVAFGSIPECIADYYPLDYVFSTAFKLLEDGVGTSDSELSGTSFHVLVSDHAVIYNDGVSLAALAEGSTREVNFHANPLGEGLIPISQ